MKTLLSVILTCALALSAVAQTNVLYAYVGDYSTNPQPKVSVTATLLSPNPRTVNDLLITQQPITRSTDNTGKAYYTNVVWGKYRIDLGGVPGTSFIAIVGTNTLGLNSWASLVTNTAALPPNPASNYYTQAQINSILANLTNLDSVIITNIFQGIGAPTITPYQTNISALYINTVTGSVYTWFIIGQVWK